MRTMPVPRKPSALHLVAHGIDDVGGVPPADYGAGHGYDARDKASSRVRDPGAGFEQASR